MCGRYFIDEKTEREINNLVDEIDQRVRNYFQEGMNSQRVDVHPSEQAVLIAGYGEKLYATCMRWGFPTMQSKQLLINARAETALEKPTFSDSVMKRRCIIPAAGFYEWDKEKNKVTFYVPEAPCIFLAGFYKIFANENRFTILTTAANESMISVHDRMPLILSERDLRDWICETGKTKEFLRSNHLPYLSKEQSYEQFTLDL